MEKKIFKYLLSRTDEQRIPMPKFSEIQSVGLQNGRITVWAVVDPNQPEVKRTFRLVGTGHPLEHDFETKYQLIGRVDDSQFVWHVFVLDPNFET